MKKQRTIKKKIRLSGNTLWAKGVTTLWLSPAEPGTGVVLRRVDMNPALDFKPKVRNASVESNRVIIRNGQFKLSFVEHLLAAIYGLGVDNITVDIDGEELPFFDGSSSEYVKAIKRAGIVEQDAPHEKLSIKKSFILISKGRVFYLSPAPRLGISYVFFHKGLNLRRFLDVGAIFARSIAPARTFASGTFPEFEYPFGVRKSKKLSFPYPARFSDEMLRHKVLDMVGDLALLGKQLAAHIWAFGTGHLQTHEAVKLLLKET